MHLLLAVMFIAIPATAWLDIPWLKNVIALCLSIPVFNQSAKYLESIVAPWQPSVEDFGRVEGRMWSERAWKFIRVGSLCAGTVVSTLAHSISSEAGPHLILGGLLVLLAARLVAAGLSRDDPQSWWQTWLKKTTRWLTELAPLEYVPNPYRAPVALFLAVLLLLWVQCIGLEWMVEHGLQWFMVSKSTLKHPSVG